MKLQGQGPLLRYYCSSHRPRKYAPNCATVTRIEVQADKLDFGYLFWRIFGAPLPWVKRLRQYYFCPVCWEIDSLLFWLRSNSFFRLDGWVSFDLSSPSRSPPLQGGLFLRHLVFDADVDQGAVLPVLVSLKNWPSEQLLSPLNCRHTPKLPLSTKDYS